MATQNLGRVGLVPKGEWVSTEEYVPLDLVSHDGNAWAAKRNNTNVEPTTVNDDDWQLISDNADLVATVQGYKNDAAASAGAAANSAAAAASSAAKGTEAQAMIAGTESTLTASKAHVEGSYFIYNGLLYIANADIAQGDTIELTGENQNCSAVILGDNLAGLIFTDRIYNSLTNDGQYTIKASDLESGLWDRATKRTNSTRARTKYLIPVRNGMSITYSNTTYDIYWGILETPTSTEYITGTSGWRTGGSGTEPIEHDGWLTFVIKNHNDDTLDVNPADYNSVVTIKTKLRQLIDAMA